MPLFFQYFLNIPLHLGVCILTVCVMKAQRCCSLRPHTSASFQMLQFAHHIFVLVRNPQNVYELLVGHVSPFWGSVSITDLGMSHRNYRFSGWWAGYLSSRYILFLRDWLARAVFGIVTGCCPRLSTLSSLCWRAVSVGISLPSPPPHGLPVPPFPYLSKQGS